MVLGGFWVVLGSFCVVLCCSGLSDVVLEGFVLWFCVDARDF